MNATDTIDLPHMIDEEALIDRIAPLRQRAFLVGGAAFVLALILALALPKVFLPAYLATYVFVLGISVGSLGLLLLHYIVGGYWGFVIRRPLEASAMAIPYLAVLFLPIALGARSFYAWADPEVVKGSQQLMHKAGYLNLGFWLVRAAVYLGLWTALAYLARRGSRRQDESADPAPTHRTQSLAAPSLVLVFLSTTFAAIDWMMSIEPKWYSSIYGAMVMVGWALSALTAMTIVSSMLASHVRSVAPISRPTGFHDLGNLTLAFVMLWAYMSFSQYLIIWAGNLSEEVPWYLARSYGGWRYVCMALMLFHFFVPFFLLLVRENKRERTRLWKIGVGILVMHLLNDVWLIIPAFPMYQWAQILCVAPALLAVGGVWLWAFLSELGSRPLVPRHDPLLEAALEHGGEGH
jgi:hypothetical protein